MYLMCVELAPSKDPFGRVDSKLQSFSHEQLRWKFATLHENDHNSSYRPPMTAILALLETRPDERQFRLKNHLKQSLDNFGIFSRSWLTEQLRNLDAFDCLIFTAILLNLWNL